jgi:membrane-bound serine protease (ClpP class)
MQPGLPRRVATLAAWALLICLGLTGMVMGHHPAGAQTETVLRLRIEDTISPVKARVIDRAVQRTTESGAQLLVIELDTPGGLYSSTREIVETLLGSPVPVVVFVSPRGAHAGSAGTFITAAANIAAMTPGSNIGAATPVSSSGEEISETLADKVTNDAAALIRAIAEERGRDADALEKTVRSAASYSASEALEANIIDLIADDMDDLLSQVDGLVVMTTAGERTLQVAEADVQEIKMQWRERFVDFISNPNIAFLLLTLGSLGLVFEMLTPGAIGPGVAGIICLGLGFLALGNLPFNWAGVAFIILAVVLAALEIFVSGFGALGIGAVVSLIVGGLLLFGDFGGGKIIPASFPTVSVNRWVLVGVGGALLIAAGYLAYEVIMSRTRWRRQGAVPGSSGRDGRSSPAHLVGQTGTVTSALRPRGVVALADETWSGVSNDGLTIPAGRRVRVVAVDGLLITVESVSGPAAVEGQE